VTAGELQERRQRAKNYGPEHARKRTKVFYKSCNASGQSEWTDGSSHRHGAHQHVCIAIWAWVAHGDTRGRALAEAGKALGEAPLVLMARAMGHHQCAAAVCPMTHDHAAWGRSKRVGVGQPSS
jgi:hypothetical protein